MESNHHRSAKETLANDLRRYIAEELCLRIGNHPAYEFVKANIAPIECGQLPSLEKLSNWPDKLSPNVVAQTLSAFYYATRILTNKLDQTPWPTRRTKDNKRVPDGIFFDIEVGDDEWLIIELDIDCIGEVLTGNFWVYVELPFIEFSGNRKLAAFGQPNFFLTWEWLKKEGRTFPWLLETLEEDFQKSNFSSEDDDKNFIQFMYEPESDLFNCPETRLKAFGQTDTGFVMPSYQDCISVGVRPTLIADVTIWNDCRSIPNLVHKEGSCNPIIIEVVHRNGISDKKKQDLQRLAVATRSRIICHEISANSIQYKTTPIVKYWKLRGAREHTFVRDY